MGGEQITDLGIQPEWLQDVLKEQKQRPLKDYVVLNDLAEMIHADPHSIGRYVRRMGIEPVRLNKSAFGHTVLCVTKEEAKEIVRFRIKEGYVI